MTMIALPHPIILTPIGGSIPTGPMTSASGVGSSGTFTFNAAGDKIAIYFIATSTTPPDLLAFYVNVVTTTGTAGTWECTLENVTTGDPSGAVTNSATGSTVVGDYSAAGVKTVAGMAGTASLTTGTIYAVVLTAGSSWDRSHAVRGSIGTTQGALGFPWIKTKDVAGSWTAVSSNNLGWCFGFADSGGTYIQIPGLMGAYNGTLPSFSSSTNPDERGNRFNLGIAVRICGVHVLWTGGSAPGANDDVKIKLLSSHTATPVEERSITIEGESTNTSLNHSIMFASGFDTTASTTYAVTIEALGTETQSLVLWSYTSNAHLAGVLGTSFYSTTRNDLGNCTDSNSEIYGVFPIISHVDSGAAGGLAASPVRGFIA